MRLLLVSTELPFPTRGGSLCLHRLLGSLPGHETSILTHEEQTLPWPWPVLHLRRGRWFHKLWRSRFGWRLQNASLTRGWELPLAAARRTVRTLRPDFILTVGYGPGLVSARRLAAATQVPLASLFMDWWPDLACNHLGVPRSLHGALEAEFVRLHRASRVSFHFSSGMQRALGHRPGDVVLYPIAGNASPGRSAPDPALLAYAGLSTGLYEESLSAVVFSGGRHPTDRLELTGPGLPSRLANNLPAGVRHHGFLDAEALTEFLQQAGALLVVLPFDTANHRLARTSFSSKFTDYCRLGRPIIIWGPPDAAIVEFATETGAALPVTTPDADAVWRAFHRLQTEPDLAAQLAAGATRAHASHFAPDVVKARFARTLESALS